MGNWRTVRVVGTVDAAHVRPLHDQLFYDLRSYGEQKNPFGPLTICGPSLRGLNDWVKPQMDCVGNCAERDYTPLDIVAQLERVLPCAPSLAIKIHCGGDYESQACINTITVADGRVALGPPEVTTVGAMSAEQSAANFREAMTCALAARVV